MERRQRISQSSAVVAALVLLLGSAGLLGGATPGRRRSTRSSLPLDECTWSSTGRNQFFSIRPGDWLLLEGEDDGEDVRVQIKVLNQTKKITFKDDEGESLTVYARVVEEREWKDGELVEVSRNYYARCVQTGDIYYFGEDVDIYEDGVIVSHDGAWLAGKDTGEGKAHPGLIMPGTFLLGSRYFQELASRGGAGPRGAPQDGADRDDPGRDVRGMRRGQGDDAARAGRREHQASTAPSSGSSWTTS